MDSKLENLLDRHFGRKSPNLPTRVLYCGMCRKKVSVKQIEKGVCCGHRLSPEVDSVWNCLRTLIPL
jgi:hypothetical protein